MEKSEFGRGLSYCLGLFLCHSERSFSGDTKYEEEMDERSKKYGKVEDYSYSTEMWFNGASDHLYDLEIPEDLSKSLKSRLKRFQEKVLHWGHGFGNDATKKDKHWAIQEAKDLLRLIDKAHGIKVEKGQWE